MEENGRKEIVRLENSNDAQTVIRSLRSRLSSRRRYQDAFGGVENSKSLNETIFKTSQQRHAIETQKAVVDARLQEHSDRNDMIRNNDLFDEFDESTPCSSSASAYAVSSGRRQQLSSSNNSNNHNSTLENAVSGNNKKSDDSDDDDFLHDDDESTDRLELFQGFVAPRSKIAQELSRANSGTNKKDVISNAAATIGGKGVTIKPGQAIRVKPGSRAKRQEDL